MICPIMSRPVPIEHKKYHEGFYSKVCFVDCQKENCMGWYNGKNLEGKPRCSYLQRNI